MLWTVPNMWKNGECFILGGGGSLPRQFGVPEEVIQSVQTGNTPLNVYSPYFSTIHDKHIIGINAAYLLGNWIDIIFFGDNGFFDKHQQGLIQHPSLKVSSSDRLKPWVKYLRKHKDLHGISEDASKVCWNHNSGGAAISLAWNLGVKRIILLGFDMNYDKGDRMHWHNVYGNKRNAIVFEKHLASFPQIAKDAKRLGLEILNANPNSNIEDFKKVSLNEVL